ncbi:MAG: PilZ domain-containing protein [Terriglobia bacterium]
MAFPTDTEDRQFASRRQRFAADLPFRYRETGTEVWHEGRTVNISVTGILFRTERVLRPQTSIEMVVTLPAVMHDVAPAEMRCRGLIVRTELGPGGESLPAHAASIVRCRFGRPRTGSRSATPAPIGPAGSAGPTGPAGFDQQIM